MNDHTEGQINTASGLLLDIFSTILNMKLTLLVDENAVMRAKTLGLNLSRFVEMQLEKYIANSESKQTAYNEQRIRTNAKKCGGPDLNRRTPTGMDPESIAFDLARQPPQIFWNRPGLY